MKLFAIRLSLGIFVFYLEYFNNIANITRESKNLYEKSFFGEENFSNNLFLLLFLAQFHIFCIARSASIGYKIVNKKNVNKMHNYFQHRKDKSHNDALTR